MSSSSKRNFEINVLIRDRWANLDMLTCEIHFEKGKPLSLANAHTSREQVASAVMFPEKIKRKRMTLRSNDIPVLPVLLKS
jgi:hypothetical protein